MTGPRDEQDWAAATAALNVAELVSERRAAKVRPTRVVAERLVSAAMTLFAERGFEAVTVQEIAERAGVTSRTFFRYYPTKETVVVDLFDRSNTRLVELIRTTPADNGVQDMLRDAVGRWFQEYEDFYRATTAITEASPSLQSAVLLRSTTWEEHLADVLRERFPELDDDVRWALALLTFGVLRVAHQKATARNISYEKAAFDVFEALAAVSRDPR
ncbi:TetR/AcrR family transcriptional regulator [Modestobacter roseus]|uniref:TetR family transcriptional regulator n=1 Tax=Modestobacter roseus TaxID=1181884 RepID=A0A562IVW6_9ACTN|nr:TetR family transcriptional regulator [Modestobacter roseus]MQA34933.1 TetR family transcriptional regulator [Modestobacter roseus]TWH75181.1 TetR family transcriptional regulator [Modestobacter roseus]